MAISMATGEEAKSKQDEISHDAVSISVWQAERNRVVAQFNCANIQDPLLFFLPSNLFGYLPPSL